MIQPKKIVLINGSGGVGKDTFVNCCSNYVFVKNVSSVDMVKVVAGILGWDGVTKDEKTRKFLSDLKLLSTEYCNHPFNYMSKKIDEFMVSSYNNEEHIKAVLFLHIREPNELQKMKDAYSNSIAVCITNPRIEKIDSNMADANVYSFSYDYYIDNDGTVLDLQTKALWFLESIFNNKKEDF